MYQCQVNELKYFKCNNRGKGYRIRARDITTFQEQVIFLKSSDNEEWNHEKNSAPKVGTSSSAQASWSSSVASKLRRKVGSQAKEYDSASKIETGVKRIKNVSWDEQYLRQEEEETPVGELLFSNNLLLRTIFANLEVEDLKCCRLVNSLWNLEATKILLKRDCLAAIQISSGTVTIHDSVEYKHLISFEDFLNIFTNSKLFPSNFFAVNSDRLSRNVIKFFRENGHLVKSFCFDPGHPDSVEVLDANAGNILLLAATCFPNLTKLKLAHFYEYEANAAISLAMELIPELSNLHTLEISSAFQEDVVSQILKKARNLQNIFYFHGSESLDYVSSLDTLMKCQDVIPRLKNIRLLLSVGTLDTYEELLKQKPRISSIEEIIVESCGAEVGRFLTAFFHECSDSLKEIVGLHSFMDLYGLRPLGSQFSLLHLPELSFPVFPNVKKLQIDIVTLQNPGANLAEIFPNLATFEFDGTWAYDPKEYLGRAMSPLLSVRHLKVKWISVSDHYISEFWLKVLCAMCPNVTSAEFCNPIEVETYEYVWKLSKLQDLHLEIGRNPELCALDSAFTGFSVETAKNLFNMDADYWGLSAEVESLRIKPSIVDLKELRRLSIRLFDSTVHEREEWAGDEDGENPSIVPNVDVIFDPGDGKAFLKVDGEILLSYITKRFALDLCSRLQLNVSVRFTHYTSYHNYNLLPSSFASLV